MSRARSESGKNIVHRRIELRPAGVDGSAVVTKAIRTGPAILRFIAVDYISQPVTTDLVISNSVDGAAGDALFTVTSSNTDITPKPITMTAGVDEAANVLATTDASSGGMPVKEGVFFDVAQGDGQTTGDEVIIVDLWYEECEYLQAIAVADSGADGVAVSVRQAFTRNKGAGVIRAIKVDYQNMPATTDILVKDGSSTGTTLFTRTSSLTDIALSPVGMAGVNEVNAAVDGLTDAVDGGWPFKYGIYVDVAEADAFTGGDEKIVLEFWVDT